MLKVYEGWNVFQIELKIAQMKRLLINVGRHFVWAFKLSGKFVIRESDYGELQIFAKTIPYSQPAANANTDILSLDEEKILNLHLKSLKEALKSAEE